MASVWLSSVAYTRKQTWKNHPGRGPMWNTVAWRHHGRTEKTQSPYAVEMDMDLESGCVRREDGCRLVGQSWRSFTQTAHAYISACRESRGINTINVMRSWHCRCRCAGGRYSARAFRWDEAGLPACACQVRRQLNDITDACSHHHLLTLPAPSSTPKCSEGAPSVNTSPITCLRPLNIDNAGKPPPNSRASSWVC